MQAHDITDLNGHSVDLARTRSGSTVGNADKPTTPHISFWDILRQTRKDLFGKEVQTSPTYSYQWIADQAGHIGLGTVFVLCTWWIAGWWTGSYSVKWAWIGFFATAILISAIELWDYWDASGRLDRLFDATCDREDLRKNVFAAIWYVVLGAAVALSALASWSPLLLFFVPVSIVVPALYWLPQKIRFQQVGLPFLFRLPEFKLKGFLRTQAEEIDGFVRTSGDSNAKHIAIIGALGSGKTSLAVGIATEGAFNRKKGRYITLSKLRQIAHLATEPKPPPNMLFWPWRQSQILVVDDVVSAVPNSTADTPDQLRAALKIDLGHILPSLRQRHTVWCLGAEVEDSGRWVEAFKEGTGIREKDLLVVTLKNAKDEHGSKYSQIGLHPASRHKWEFHERINTKPTWQDRAHQMAKFLSRH